MFLNMIINNLVHILLAVVIVFGTWIGLRLVRSLFRALRVRKKIPTELIGVIERIARYGVIFAGSLLLFSEISAVLGLSGVVAPVIPPIVISAIIVATTMIAFQGTKSLFEWLTEKKRLPRKVMDAVEIVVRYAIFFIGFSLVAVYIAATLGWAKVILEATLSWFVQNISSFIFIAVTITVAWIASRFYKIFFEDLKRKTRFHPQVIDLVGTLVRYFTYGILGFFVLSVLLQIVGLPEVSQTAATVFTLIIGMAVSFAATGTVGNFIAGLILMSWRPFSKGDRIEAGGGAYGDVVDFDVMFTKIRTPKDEMIYVPNLSVLGNKIMNYSSLGRCIVHQKVTLGYDASRRTVEELLLKAVSATEGLLKEPEPFVLVTKLDEFYVEYEANAYTDQPNKLLNIYSDLMKNILDLCEKEGIELLSPAYSVTRYGRIEEP